MENKSHKKKGKLSDLPLRTLLNTIVAFFVGVVLYFAERPFFRPILTAAVALMGGLALWEYYRLLKKKGCNPAVWIGIISSILYFFAVFFKTTHLSFTGNSFWDYLPEIVLAASFLSLFIYYSILRDNPIINIPTTFFGLLYIAIPLGLIIQITYFFSFTKLALEGTFWLLYLIAVTKSADMGGYFVGRFLGRHKLAEELSPNKTKEGALGGLVAAILMSVLLLFIGQKWGGVFNRFSYTEFILLGLVMGFLGQVGDLAESLLKRDVGVKDSNKIPGVGGLLDMVDSLLFTSPLVYLFLKFHYL